MSWPSQCTKVRKVFRIGTVRCNWPMSAHASQAFSIMHCTNSEDLPKVPGPFRSGGRKFQGATGPGSKSGRERMSQEAKEPGSESSKERISQGPVGQFSLGNELAQERNGWESFHTYLHILIFAFRKVSSFLTNVA